MSTFLKSCPVSLRHIAPALVLLFAATLVFACGEEGGIGGVDSGDLEIQPDPLQFPDTAINTTRTEQLEFINEGDSDISLTNMSLEENPYEEGRYDVFNIVDREDGDELQVTTDNDNANPKIIEVEYTPEASEPYSAQLSFDTNISNEPTVDIAITADPPEPEMIAPSSIDFERVPEGSTQGVTAEIENIGNAELVMDNIHIGVGENDFDVEFPTPLELVDTDDLSSEEQEAIDALPEEAEYAPPFLDEDEIPEWLEEIEPGESGMVRVYFTAPSDSFQRGELHLVTNDPGAQPYEAVNLIANSEAPCLEVVGGEVDFGPAALANSTQQTVTLNNCSASTTTEVYGIELGDIDDYDPDDASHDFDADADIRFDLDENSLPAELRGETPDAEPENQLGPGESISILVSYTPEQEQVDEAFMKLESNDDASPLYVPVTGEGVDRECPVAIAQARNADGGAWSDMEVTGVPLDEIEFDGSESWIPDPDNPDSEDPDGEISYEWSVTDLPQGSNAQFDDPSAGETVLPTDIAGIFTAELMVYDQYGIGSCDPARIDLVILPESDIHVELTWDVPAAEDGVGVDLDLHYLHPNGNWSEAPWGIYYANTMQDDDWGDGSDVYLDIDSLTGAEPENIYHSDPDPAYDYSVGVYYFGDPVNYGATDARVRIYLNNALMFDDEQRFENAGTNVPNEGDFWHVGDVVVDGGLTFDSEIGQFYDDAGFPDE